MPEEIQIFDADGPREDAHPDLSLRLFHFDFLLSVHCYVLSATRQKYLY